ncbi:MAG TPA: 8-amino-7-oxononanoate synthase, partial [Flavobacterium sp.]
MKNFPQGLSNKLNNRKADNSVRELRAAASVELIDFSSNDYLGLASSRTVFLQSHQYLVDSDIIKNGSTGSRLISGNHQLYSITENVIAEFHHAESALIFNSGYDANLGFF